MIKKRILICNFLSAAILVIVVLLGCFFENQIPSFVFLLLLFSCCLFMLPYLLYSIKPEQEPSAVTWRIFFSIMIGSFLLVFWLCNYTKLKEMFQVLTLMAFSIALAEYLTRRYLK